MSRILIKQLNTGTKFDSLVVGTPTDGNKGTGTVNATNLYSNGTEIKPIVLVTSTSLLASGSTTSDITGIPSWVKRITVVLKAFSLTAAE